MRWRAAASYSRRRPARPICRGGWSTPISARTCRARSTPERRSGATSRVAQRVLDDLLHQIGQGMVAEAVERNPDAVARIPPYGPREHDELELEMGKAVTHHPR